MYTEEDLMKARNSGFKEGQKHMRLRPSEETKEFMKKVDGELEDIKIKIAELPEKLIEKMDKRYVSKETFEPIKKLVYGTVGAVLVAALTAILALIFK